jgi:ferredoxin
MSEDVQDLARKWLEGKEVDAIFGLREQDGYIAPYLFTDANEVANLTVSTEYRLCRTCRPSKDNILSLMQRREPNMKIGIVARGCEERTLIELAKRGQIDLEKIKIMGIACSQEEAKECKCERPYPINLVLGKKVEGVSEDKEVDALLSKSLPERLAFWRYELSKCIKCYGCRDACPMCFCKDCKMEQKTFTETGSLPPEIPMFLFIRWYHISDRCIGCGECEKACPVGIPLLTIFRQLRRDMKDLFDYEAGMDVEQEAPLLTTLDEMPMKEEEVTSAV